MVSPTQIVHLKLWNYFSVLRDDGLFDYHRHLLEELGKESGLLGLIFGRA